ncbi:hypothetical protein [Paludisphaera soli]|uniref:hypothetical protein n=1 Tax=Paludisphaera soli TaxID=2712865 RepID=UPI0013ED14E8|nr:hypothetical protein [Paludisphaera soli]
MKEAAIRIIPLSLRALALGLGLTSAAHASPYTATYLGRFEDLRSNGSNLDNASNGVSYLFPITTRYPEPGEIADPPMATLPDGNGGTRAIPMVVTAINDAGTYIGGVSDPAGPPGVTTRTFTVRSEDGRYAPLVELTPATRGWIALSQSNQILLSDPEKSWLYDVATRTATPVDSLAPPQLLASYAAFHPTGIDDRGDLLIRASRPRPGGAAGEWDVDAYLLTPPGLAAPSPVPEPSALWIFGGVAAALGVRAFVGRRRAMEAA